MVVFIFEVYESESLCVHPTNINDCHKIFNKENISGKWPILTKIGYHGKSQKALRSKVSSPVAGLGVIFLN